MTCRDVPNSGVPTYDTIQQMYVGLGVRRLPTGVHMNVDGTLPSGGLNLGVLTPDSVACFDTLAGITGGSTYNNSALHGNIRDLRALVDYFRGAGNTGDANVISGEELDAYVTAYMATTAGRATGGSAQDYRDLTAANLTAYVSMVQYLGGGDPRVPTAPAPAEANAAAIRSYGSIQQMYTGLVGTVTGSGAASTRSSVSEDVPEGGIPLGVLTQPNIQRFGEAIGWTSGNPTTPLARNAKDILDLVDYFRGAGNLPLEGDAGAGDPAVIASAEVDAYVRAYVANERTQHPGTTMTFDSYRPVVVGNLRALVACVQQISNPPAIIPAPITLTADAASLAIPAAGDAGAGGVRILPNATSPFTAQMQVFVDASTTALAGVTIDPARGITIPYGRVPAGPHTVTVKRADGNVFGTATFTTASSTGIIDGSGGAGGDAGVGGTGGGSDAGVDGAGGGGRPRSGPSDGTVFALLFGAIAVIAAARFGIPAMISAWRNRSQTPDPVTPDPVTPDPPDHDDAIAAAQELARVRAAAAAAAGPGSTPPPVVDATNVIFEPAGVADVRSQIPQTHVLEAQLRVVIPRLRDSRLAPNVPALARELTRQFGRLDAGVQQDLFIAEFTKRQHVTLGGLPLDWVLERATAYMNQDAIRDHMDLTPQMINDMDRDFAREAERTPYRENMQRLLRGEALPIPGAI